MHNLILDIVIMKIHELLKPIGVRNSSNNYFVLSRMRLSWDRNIKKWTLPQLIQTYIVFQGSC